MCIEIVGEDIQDSSVGHITRLQRGIADHCSEYLLS